MFDEVIALKDKEISQSEFDEKLAFNQTKFNFDLQTKVKYMLPNKILPKIGNGLIFKFENVMDVLTILTKSKTDVIFISKPTSDKYFNGYQSILQEFFE